MNASDRKKPGSAREDRLKAALRDNLRRRKAQARGRADADEGLAPGAAAGNDRPDGADESEPPQRAV